MSADTVRELRIEDRLHAHRREHDVDAYEVAAANQLLSRLVDCLTVQRDNGITAEAERFAYAALADFIRWQR